MQEIKDTLSNFFSALEKLKELGIILNAKDFTGQIGEWIASIVYDGNRSQNGIQRDWDFISNEKFYQVKSSAKSKSTTVKYSKVDYRDDAKIDFLIIIVFSENYELNSFYEIPWEIAKKKIKTTGKKVLENKINWSDVAEFKKNLEELKQKHEILAIFIK
jgi:hypothetical protein